MQPSPAMGPWRGGTGGIAGETFPNGVWPLAWVRAKLKQIENGMPVHYRYSHSSHSDTTRHKSRKFSLTPGVSLAPVFSTVFPLIKSKILHAQQLDSRNLIARGCFSTLTISGNLIIVSGSVSDSPILLYSRKNVRENMNPGTDDSADVTRRPGFSSMVSMKNL